MYSFELIFIATVGMVTSHWIATQTLTVAAFTKPKNSAAFRLASQTSALYKSGYLKNSAAFAAFTEPP